MAGINLALDPYIEVIGVSHSFPDSAQALAEVSLSIPAGSFISLVGSSGVGKSTLLRILGGLLIPTTGRVTIDGQPPDRIAQPVGIVFQQHNLMPWRTAAENVRLPLEINGHQPRSGAERVHDLLQLVGLHGFENSYPAQLSGGMAQRVALARALVHEPQLLLLDEPFGALDALTRERMGLELLRIWQVMPVTVFMVTHSIQEAVLLSDMVLVMNGFPGRITHTIPIDLPRPRRPEMMHTIAFAQSASDIREAIKGNEKRPQ
jgi:NitT/TauT family transport system ATP-binding protein